MGTVLFVCVGVVLFSMLGVGARCTRSARLVTHHARALVAAPVEARVRETELLETELLETELPRTELLETELPEAAVPAAVALEAEVIEAQPTVAAYLHAQRTGSALPAVAVSVPEQPSAGHAARDRHLVGASSGVGGYAPGGADTLDSADTRGSAAGSGGAAVLDGAAVRGGAGIPRGATGHAAPGGGGPAPSGAGAGEPVGRWTDVPEARHPDDGEGYRPPGPGCPPWCVRDDVADPTHVRFHEAAAATGRWPDLRDDCAGGPSDLRVYVCQSALPWDEQLTVVIAGLSRDDVLYTTPSGARSIAAALVRAVDGVTLDGDAGDRAPHAQPPG